MMLAYQPVKTLTKVNVAIGQGMAAAERILPVIDIENKISLNSKAKDIQFSKGDIVFNKINFSYKSNFEKKVLKMFL